jgi:arsenate reductase-like glutaredoxin family protein
MRILKELGPLSGVELQDIKSGSYTATQLEDMKNLAGSYEALFSRRAQLFTQRKLKDKALTEADYKKLLLEHYTFLKRPVIVVDNAIFIGNSKKVVAAAREALHP